MPSPTRRRRPYPTSQQRSHTILVALDVEPTTDSNTAMALITTALSASPLLNPSAPDTILESWHFAEDDGPEPADDVMSAVFCRKGCQAQAHAVLKAAGLA